MTYARPKGGYQLDPGFHVLPKPELCAECGVQSPVATTVDGPIHPSCRKKGKGKRK